VLEGPPALRLDDAFWGRIAAAWALLLPSRMVDQVGELSIVSPNFKLGN